MLHRDVRVAFPRHESFQHGEAVGGGGPGPPRQAFEPRDLLRGQPPRAAVVPELVEPAPQPERTFLVVGWHARVPFALLSFAKN
jgi:hypothetical protein